MCGRGAPAGAATAGIPGAAPAGATALDRAVTDGSAEAVAERAKASVRAKVEHPFRVVKRQFGHVKARYRGLAKNGHQLYTLFGLANVVIGARGRAVA